MSALVCLFVAAPIGAIHAEEEAPEIELIDWGILDPRGLRDSLTQLESLGTDKASVVQMTALVKLLRYDTQRYFNTQAQDPYRDELVGALIDKLAQARDAAPEGWAQSFIELSRLEARVLELTLEMLDGHEHKADVWSEVADEVVALRGTLAYDTGDGEWFVELLASRCYTEVARRSRGSKAVEWLETAAASLDKAVEGARGAGASDSYGLAMSRREFEENRIDILVAAGKDRLARPLAEAYLDSLRTDIARAGDDQHTKYRLTHRYNLLRVRAIDEKLVDEDDHAPIVSNRRCGNNLFQIDLPKDGRWIYDLDSGSSKIANFILERMDGTTLTVSVSRYRWDMLYTFGGKEIGGDNQKGMHELELSIVRSGFGEVDKEKKVRGRGGLSRCYKKVRGVELFGSSAMGAPMWARVLGFKGEHRQTYTISVLIEGVPSAGTDLLVEEILASLEEQVAGR